MLPGPKPERKPKPSGRAERGYAAGESVGRKARAAVALVGISATVGALVAAGTALTIYLIVLAIQRALG